MQDPSVQSEEGQPPSSGVLNFWRNVYRGNSAAALAIAAALPPQNTAQFSFDRFATLNDEDEAEGMCVLNPKSPTHGLLASTTPVQVFLMDPDIQCLGILNQKASKKYRDPVLRLCRRPKSGSDKCLQFSHIDDKMTLPLPRWMISCPKISDKTLPACFAIPAIPVNTLPADFQVGSKAAACLASLSLTIGIWRTIFENYPGKEVLTVDTTVASPRPQTIPTPLPPLAPEMSPSTVFKPPLSSTAKPRLGDVVDIKPDIAARVEAEVEPDEEDVWKGTSVEGNAFEQMVILQGYMSHEEGESQVSHFDSSEEDAHEMMATRSRASGRSKAKDGPSRSQARPLVSDPVSRTNDSNFQHILNVLENATARLGRLELDCVAKDDALAELRLKNKEMRSQLKQDKAVWLLQHKELANNVKTSQTQLSQDFQAAKSTLGTIAKMSEDIDRLNTLTLTLGSRISTMEDDLRAPTGVLQEALAECHRVAAAADQGAIDLGGCVFRSEWDVLSFIELLPFDHKYQVFADPCAMLFLAEGGVNTFEQAMTASKAIKGAEFPSMFVAKMNTSHTVPFPPIIASTGATGETSVLKWTAGWKSYSTFTGGTKDGAKASLRRKLIKCKKGMRKTINQKLPVSRFPKHNAVALAMLELSDQYIGEFLEAVTTFYEAMLEAGVPESKSWAFTQNFTERFFKDLDNVKADLGEEDVDSGMIWSSMMTLLKCEEYSHYRFVEHPAVGSMLVHSLLELKATDDSKELEAAAKEALSKASASIKEIEKVAKQVTASHNEATSALNQIKQMKETLKKLDKSS